MKNVIVKNELNFELPEEIVGIIENVDILIKRLRLLNKFKMVKLLPNVLEFYFEKKLFNDAREIVIEFFSDSEKTELLEKIMRGIYDHFWFPNIKTINFYYSRTDDKIRDLNKFFEIDGWHSSIKTAKLLPEPKRTKWLQKILARGIGEGYYVIELAIIASHLNGELTLEEFEKNLNKCIGFKEYQEILDSIEIIKNFSEPKRTEASQKLISICNCIDEKEKYLNKINEELF